MEKKIIIVPDVHGRDFWKEAVKDRENAKVVFLGDYLDPYEKRTDEDLLENLKEIIALKESDPENITLLIGNHDRHYMKGSHGKFSRYSPSMQSKLNDRAEEFFKKNIFEIIHEEEVFGTKFVFTHAGVKKDWYYNFIEEENGEGIDAEKIREAYEKNPYYFDSLISFYRGGTCYFGSPVWADIREYGKEDEWSGKVQIFGHTQLAEKAVDLDDKIYCLDVRRCFFIDENGVVREMNGNKVEIAVK